MPNAVIFDMDGVIIDSQAAANPGLLKNIREHGAPITEEELNALQGSNHHEL